MERRNIYAVYYSATYSTRNIVREVAKRLDGGIIEIDITQEPLTKEIVIGKNDVLLFGMPSYSGRIPTLAHYSVRNIRGEGARAIIVCVYGNRDYDDTMLEMDDILKDGGFKTIAAGAFIAQHSIMSRVAEGRPDAADMEKIKEFGEHCAELLNREESPEGELRMPGSHPYRESVKVPLRPKTGNGCSECGYCALNCPTNAISKENPKKVNPELCISCGRCVVLCPTGARKWSGIIYKLVAKRFFKAYGARKEPEMMYLE